jgi:hypothetical protein
MTPMPEPMCWLGLDTENMINLNEYEGRFIRSYGETCFNSLDGSDVAAWLQSKGYTVVSNGDTGRNGYAETACGWRVSTNGYVRRVSLVLSVIEYQTNHNKPE